MSLNLTLIVAECSGSSAIVKYMAICRAVTKEGEREIGREREEDGEAGKERQKKRERQKREHLLPSRWHSSGGCWGGSKIEAETQE